MVIHYSKWGRLSLAYVSFLIAAANLSSLLQVINMVEGVQYTNLVLSRLPPTWAWACMNKQLDTCRDARVGYIEF